MNRVKDYRLLLGISQLDLAKAIGVSIESGQLFERFDGLSKDVIDRLKDLKKFADKGGCEFVSQFAIPFPSYVFLDLMGMPRDKVGQFIDWEDRIMRSPDLMDRAKAAREVYEYLKEHKDKQKDHPSNAFLAGMVAGEVDGRCLDLVPGTASNCPVQ